MPGDVKQFNVYLPVDLIREVKQHAVDSEPSMTPRGIEGLIIETHNWGEAVAFWTGLGFKVEFETDHHSGQLRHPGGGVYLFIAERPEGEPLETRPLIPL